LLLAACGSKKESAPAPSNASPAGSASVTPTDASATTDATTTTGDATGDASGDNEPADAPNVDVPANKRITSDGIARVTRTTPGKRAALAKLIPEVEWEEATEDLDGERVKRLYGWRPGKEPRELVLRGVLAGRRLGELTVYATGYRTETGIEIGQTGAQLAKAYPDLTCAMTDYRPRTLECDSSSLENVTFGFLPTPDMSMGDIDAKQVAPLQISSIRWSAPDE
jgi:hypothetical protein